MTRHIVRPEDKPTTVRCPKCGDVIVYNGNFFCNRFERIEYSRKTKDIFRVPGTCDWALPHPVRRKRDREIVNQLFSGGFIQKKDYG